jgi:hypothetical protein
VFTTGPRFTGSDHPVYDGALPDGAAVVDDATTPSTRSAAQATVDDARARFIFVPLLVRVSSPAGRRVGRRRTRGS